MKFIIPEGIDFLRWTGACCTHVLMKIHFCGAAGTTTGSQHLLEVNGSRILLDCGMYQGRREEAWHINKDFPYFSPADVDVVIDRKSVV